MYDMQVYNPTSRKYKTVVTGSLDKVTLAMTLGHVHSGNRRRIVRDGKVLVKR